MTSLPACPAIQTRASTSLTCPRASRTSVYTSNRQLSAESKLLSCAGLNCTGANVRGKIREYSRCPLGPVLANHPGDHFAQHHGNQRKIRNAGGFETRNCVTHVSSRFVSRSQQSKRSPAKEATSGYGATSGDPPGIARCLKYAPIRQWRLYKTAHLLEKHQRR
jgi:hypothetical protein